MGPCTSRWYYYPPGRLPRVSSLEEARRRGLIEFSEGRLVRQRNPNHTQDSCFEQSKRLL